MTRIRNPGVLEEGTLVQHKKSKLTALTGIVALLAASACGGGGGSKGGGGTSAVGTELKGTTIEVAAKWTGAEQKNFQAVLDAFHKKTGATMKYASTGEDTDAYLGPRIEGGNPPDVAVLPQPGLLRQYVAKKALKPLDASVVAQLDQHYSKYWKDLGSVGGKPYGVLIKAAQKSVVWYSTKAFSDAGVQPPATWNDLVTKTAQTLSDAGTPPFSMCAGSGWTLTDLFENIYLSQAGTATYDKLADHKIPWTDPSVGDALKTMAQIFGKDSLMLDGKKGAVQTDFPTCVTKAFGQNKAAMVIEADFVGAALADTKAKAGTDVKTFPFPKVGAQAPVELGGDIAVSMKQSKGATEFIKYLATPEAGEVWAKPGGYLSPNKDVPVSAYPDAISKQLAQAILSAGDNVRYDLSDMAPAAFGATEGKGEWKDLQDFLSNPSDVKGTQAKLEADAKKAYTS
jgi:alpha-glucoside transport system substrate-binding protein